MAHLIYTEAQDMTTTTTTSTVTTPRYAGMLAVIIGGAIALPVLFTGLGVAAAVAYGDGFSLVPTLYGLAFGWAWGLVGTLFPLRRRLCG